MNLSPKWVGALQAEGCDAVHWSTVGAPDAPDEILMEWARSAGCVIFTHDLDFGTLLALTRARGPSVVVVRTQDALPERLLGTVIGVLRTHATALEVGALVMIDETSARVRVLPLIDPSNEP